MTQYRPGMADSCPSGFGAKRPQADLPHRTSGTMLTELRNAFEELQGSEPRANASQQVAQLGRYGVRLPDDFKSYLIEVSGARTWFDDFGIDWQSRAHLAH